MGRRHFLAGVGGVIAGLLAGAGKMAEATTTAPLGHGSFVDLNVTERATVLDLRVNGTASLNNVATVNDVFSGGAVTAMTTLQHVGTMAGFFGAMPTSRPTVSGAKGSRAALESLTTALAQLGLITDNTT